LYVQVRTAAGASDFSVRHEPEIMLEPAGPLATRLFVSVPPMTSYGHTNLDLEAHWQLMGAIEALNGWLLFGLTTAFLFGMIERVLSAWKRDTLNWRAEKIRLSKDYRKIRTRHPTAHKVN
jgi:hypothetical protein